nr:hypothetical protein [uncultured Cohaesibacter sp.]
MWFRLLDVHWLEGGANGWFGNTLISCSGSDDLGYPIGQKLLIPSLMKFARPYPALSEFVEDGLGQVLFVCQHRNGKD